MRILVLSRYARMGASSRLRIFQFLPLLERSKIQVTVAPLLDDQYIKNLYTGKRKAVINIFRAYYCRILWMMQAKSYDVVWLEKEFLPWLPVWFELMFLPKQVRLLVDYDDAVFHQYDQHDSALVRLIFRQKIAAIMRRANMVVAGNAYIAEYARIAGAARVEVLPTVVDTSSYLPFKKSPENRITIGWIGSPATAHFLPLIASALLEVTARRKAVSIVAVGANVDQLDCLPITVLPWTEEQEVEKVQQFDIGIMPLPDKPFERGKCGYKLIQYMACGKPVVASPVGANAEIVRDGVDGFLANTDRDWVEALICLIDDLPLRERMGGAGRKRVEAQYSLHVAGAKMLNLLRELVGSRS